MVIGELDICTVFFEVIGLQYFSLKSLTIKSAGTSPSWIRLTYFLFVLICSTVFCVIYLSYSFGDQEEKLNAKNILMFIIENSINVGMFVVIWTSLIQSYLTTAKIKTMFLNVNEMVRIVRHEFGKKTDFKQIRKDAWKRLALSLVAFCIFHGILAVIAVLQRGPYAIISVFFGSSPILMLIFILYKFIFFATMINYQLDLIEHLLTESFQYQPIRIIDNINMYLDPSSPRIPRDDYFRKLFAIRKIYCLVYDNSLLVNESNGFSIFCVIVTMTVALTGSGYQLFLIIMGGLSAEFYPGLKVISRGLLKLNVVFSYVIHHHTFWCDFVRDNFLLQRCSSNCKFRASQGLFIYLRYFQMARIPTQLNVSECQNSNRLTIETKEFFQSFYLQLMDLPVTFSARGFFSINLPLFATIITGTLSYQIILVQFYTSR